MLSALKQKLRLMVGSRLAAQTEQFRPKLEFRLDLKNFIIETVKTPAELREVIELRRHSFIEEFSGVAGTDYVDFDGYDLAADHIVVRSKKTNELVSSYRVINSQHAKSLFSSEWFNLDQFMESPGIKIELSRAVVHKDHRNGLTLSLVWKGVAHYTKLAEARYICGCSSAKTTSQKVAESIYWHLYPGHFDGRFNIEVMPQFVHQDEFNPADLSTWEETKDVIPPLLKAYIKAGAKVRSRPAYDRVFDCVDFFTVLDLKEIDEQYHERYFG